MAARLLIALVTAGAPLLAASRGQAQAPGDQDPPPIPVICGADSRYPGAHVMRRDPAAVLEAMEWWPEWYSLNQWRFLAAPEPEPTVLGKHRPDLVSFLRREALHDAHWDPKSTAALALGRLRVQEASGDLETLVLDPTQHRPVRESAALALGMMQARMSVPLLAKVAADAAIETPLRVHAIIGLGLMRDGKALPALRQLLAAPGGTEIRVAAATALGCIGGNEAAALLVELLRSSPEVAVRAAAATGSGRCAGAWVAGGDIDARLVKCAREDREDQVRRAAVLVLHRFGEGAGVECLNRAARADRDVVTRGFAMLSLAEAAIRDDATALSRDAARHLYETVLATPGQAGAKERGYAAIALGLQGRRDPACAGALRQGLNHEPDTRTRAACAVGLGIMGDTGCIPELTAIAQRARSTTLRMYACVALGMLGRRDPRAGRTLHGLVRACADADVRSAAAMALPALGPDPGTMASVRESLQPPNPYACSSTLVLGYFRDPATIPEFITRYRAESNTGARTTCVEALGTVAEVGPPALEALAVDCNYLSAYPDMTAFHSILRLR